MIASFRHRALKRLYEHGDARGLDAKLVPKLEIILANLDVATQPSDLDMPGLKLHPLKGSYRGFWSVTVSANWRVIFKVEHGDVCDVDFVDYH